MRLLVAFAAALACAIGCAQQSDVFPDNTTTLELHVAGGLAPAPGPGSTCTPEDTTYDYVLATRALSWTACQSGSDGVFTQQPGQTTLGADAAHQLHDALAALALPADPCGADFTATLHFTTPDGASDYPQAECLVGFSGVEDALGTAAQ